ncbi:MAG: hypothetical protein J6T29_04635 [Alphaproteobacteria bacterium]|nr:hypothetical protein [Alphaproteobacteria bacterium]
MKKVMLSAAVCAMAFSANADVSEEVVVEETAQTSAFNSFYFGAGIGGSFLKSDDVSVGKNFTTKALRMDDGTVYSSLNENPGKKFGVKANRFVGSLVLGGGKVFSNNVYVGAEFLIDISKDKKISREFDHKHRYVDETGYSPDTKMANGMRWDELKEVVIAGFEADHPSTYRKDVKIGGFVPQLNFRAGYVFKNNILVYGKLGCALTKVSVDSYYKMAGSDEWIKDKDGSGSKTKPSLILGLGAEKSFGKKFSAAVEADYNFGWKHKGYKANKGWNVRALVKYNVKY